MMRLEDIGFYTLSDRRAETASHETAISRLEIIITDVCNFSCPYCRHTQGKTLSLDRVMEIIDCYKPIQCTRFSGGEPTMNRDLPEMVSYAKRVGCEKIAISTNGYNKPSLYDDLIQRGVNDISVSLDACCASTGDMMAGGVPGSWNTVVENIKHLAKQCYVTVGIVAVPDTLNQLKETVEFAHGLGVADIRVIPAAQNHSLMPILLTVDRKIIDAHPILKYRHDNQMDSRGVRGIEAYDTKKCPLALDDIAVMDNNHYPCIIYLREGGRPIGLVGKGSREERLHWYKKHNTHGDHICKQNCIDVCVDYNNKYELLHGSD